MNGFRFCLFFLIFGLIYAKIGFSEDSLNFRIKVNCDRQPTGVSINVENGTQQYNLMKSGSDAEAIYSLVLPYNSLIEQKDEKKIVGPYRLVGDWSNSKEHLYLGIKPGTPKDIDLTIFHFEYSIDNADHRELCRIDALDTDLCGTLEKYFKARAYHRLWRYENNLPYHMNALRSAKIWFDAAFKLVEKNPSIFRMDEDIEKIVTEYEERKTSDRNLKKRWELYARPGYISGMIEQLSAMDYVFIKEIPILIEKGLLDKAADLNNLAISSLDKSDSQVTKAVAKFQRVNEKMLIENRHYIAGMME